jgi:hypothetical protein
MSFDPGPTLSEVYISGQGRYMQQVFPNHTYYLMHQIQGLKLIFIKSIGGLKCFEACLSKMRCIGGQGTLEDLLR